MKFMMLMIPAVYQSGKEVDPGFVPDPKKMEEMGRFNDQMAKALKIESLNGLHPVTTGARVSFSKGKPTLIDGPFIEAKESVGGYALVDVADLDEALELAKTWPAKGAVEVRPLVDHDAHM